MRGEAGVAGGALAGAVDGDEKADVMGTTMDDISHSLLLS